MTNVSKLFVVIGCLLILVALVLKSTLVIVMMPAKPISLVILANTAFLLAILFKK